MVQYLKIPLASLFCVCVAAVIVYSSAPCPNIGLGKQQPCPGLPAGDAQGYTFCGTGCTGTYSINNHLTFWATTPKFNFLAYNPVDTYCIPFPLKPGGVLCFTSLAVTLCGFSATCELNMDGDCQAIPLQAVYHTYYVEEMCS
jgi:hypothetical protein